MAGGDGGHWDFCPQMRSLQWGLETASPLLPCSVPHVRASAPLATCVVLQSMWARRKPRPGLLSPDTADPHSGRSALRRGAVLGVFRIPVSTHKMPEVGINMGDTCANARSGPVTWDSKRPGSLPLCPRGIGVFGWGHCVSLLPHE